jgi:predicted anti-sigma-YlaC factor YlaD
MLNCREVTELCSQEMERPLRLGERMSLHAHLMMCSGCANFRNQMGALRAAAHAYAQGAAAAPVPREPSGKDG